MKMARLLGDTVFYEEKISQKRETRQNSTKITFYNQLDLIKSELSWFYFAYAYAYFGVFLRAKTSWTYSSLQGGKFCLHNISQKRKTKQKVR